MFTIEDIDIVIVRDEIPVIAKEHGWQYEFDIPSEQPADYFDMYNNTEIRQAWYETIDLAVEYLNQLGSPNNIKFIWEDILDEIDGIEFPVYLKLVEGSN